MARYASVQERVIANSIVYEGSYYNGSFCWLWTGSRKRNRTGEYYGKISYRVKRGRNKGKVRNALVHRVVIRVFKQRRLSAGMVGKHLCNFTLCCNPDHLSGGSQKANIRQAVREGRHRGNKKMINNE